MSISADWGYNECDSLSKLRNVLLSVKAALTAVGRHFGSQTNTLQYEFKSVTIWKEKHFCTLYLLVLGVLLKHYPTLPERQPF